MDVELDHELKEALRRIVEYEEEQVERWRNNPVFKDRLPEPWWSWQEVGVHWRTVQKLNLAGFLDCLAGSRRKCYKLKDREGVKRLLERLEERRERPAKAEIPGDLFDVVEGFDDLKFFIRRVLELDENVHVLLVGPPGVAKSLILKEIERLPGAYFITAGTATKVGIRDLIFEEEPRYLIIDEIDKVEDPKDLSALLTLMEDQRIVITKHGLRESKHVKCTVFAAANSIERMPPELLDRFEVFRIRPYAKDEAKKVVVGYLSRRMGVDPDLAGYIADRVLSYSSSVREAIRIAKLARSREDVDVLVGIARRYGNGR